MLEIAGSPAFSEFRLEKLLGLLRAVAPRISGVEARFVHYVDTERQLDAAGAPRP